MIIATVIRGSGIQYQGKVDHIWETYWIFVAGEVGLILTAVTAFRSFFVARQNQRDEAEEPSWYRRSKERLKLKFRSKGSSDTAWTGDSDETKVGEAGYFDNRLPQIPKPTMTGIRTFINGRRTTKSMTGTQMMQSYVDDEDKWKSVEEGRGGARIVVRHDLSMETESVRSAKCYQCGRHRSEHPAPLVH